MPYFPFTRGLYEKLSGENVDEVEAPKAEPTVKYSFERVQQDYRKLRETTRARIIVLVLSALLNVVLLCIGFYLLMHGPRYDQSDFGVGQSVFCE